MSQLPGPQTQLYLYPNLFHEIYTQILAVRPFPGYPDLHSSSKLQCHPSRALLFAHWFRGYSLIFFSLTHITNVFQPEHIQTRDRGRIISTLDFECIKDTDIHDLSFYKKPRIQTFVTDEKCSFRIDYTTDVLNEKSKYLVFPPRTEGFLYYHQRHDSLPGEVRFCLASASDTHTGMDLLLPNGLPWSIPLWYIVSAPRYKILLQKLIADGLVSTELVERCEWMFPAAWARRRRRATVLVNWNDAFAVALDTKHTKLWIAGEKGIKETMLLTNRILGEYAGESTGAYLYFFCWLCLSNGW